MPTERDAEIGLRYGEEALGERITGGEQHRWNGKQQRQIIERQDQRNAASASTTATQSASRGVMRRCNGTILGALHMLVESRSA